jgi:hypothetical protein
MGALPSVFIDPMPYRARRQRSLPDALRLGDHRLHIGELARPRHQPFAAATRRRSSGLTRAAGHDACHNCRIQKSSLQGPHNGNGYANCDRRIHLCCVSRVASCDVG